MKRIFNDIIKHTLHVTALLLVMLSATSCVDDILDDPNSFPEGDARISIEVEFSPYAAQQVRSFQDNISGKIISDIDDLVILVYDSDGNILEGDMGKRYYPKSALNPIDVVRKDEDASNGHKAENSTKKVVLSFDIPFGRYYMYAVANIGKMGSNGVRASSLDALDKMDISTVSKLLDISVDWDNDNILNNCQMLGVFTDGRGDPPHTPDNSNLDSNPNYKTIAINRSDIMCHAWLRRCASKITIDFDGSGLLENTYVYFKQATVHDIPKQCKLGSRNKVTSATQLYTNRKGGYTAPADDPTSHPNYRPNDGTRIVYSNDEDYRNWPHVARGTNSLTKIVNSDGDSISDWHSENAPALYLFENMQGDGKEGVNDKEMSVENNGDNVDGRDEEKDNMPCGSYIEVEGYYDYHTSLHVSQGHIYYRFMLGKDVKINFDTERNYHYKLTLKLRGKGNDYDWHIEYDEKEGFDVRDPYFVSYLYNHSSTIPFKYTPSDESWEVYKLKAEIVGNNWWPDHASSSIYYDAEAKKQNPRSEWARYDLVDDFNKNMTAVDKEGNTRNRFLGNGFLSLRKTSETNVSFTHTGNYKGVWNTWKTTDENRSMNDSYFYACPQPVRTTDKGIKYGIDRSMRWYYFDGTNDTSNKGDEAYTMTKNTSTGGYEFNIPMYTRAKTLIKATGHTANNPFVGHTRTAFVRLTVYLRKKDNHKVTDVKSQIVRVEQVKRVINPKGIYRKKGNNEPFHVTLMDLMSEDGENFTPIQSRGPWMAEVLGEDDFIKLNGRHKVIHGSTDTYVDFRVNFNQMNLNNTRNAVIRVRYNNYTCVHLIFVRQGYDPVDVGGTKWRISNLRNIDLADDDSDPRDEGSLFKRNGLTHAIHPINNRYDTFINANISFPSTMQSVYLSDSKGNPASSLTAWNSFNSSGNFSDDRIASMKDFSDMYSNKDIEFGFGVLYADGATTTANNVKDAYGFYYGDVEGGDKLGATRGMRGLFAYDKTNYHNIFFPMGRSGYGHRKTEDIVNPSGVLRYSCGQTAFNPQSCQPLFYGLYYSPGAIYWAKEQTTSGIIDIGSGQQIASDDNGVGFDINFFTYDTNYISLTNVFKSGWSDACFVRLKAN